MWYTRRGFLKGAVAGAASGGGLGLFGSAAWAAGSPDADILNFALIKEYLESDFYQRATASGQITDPAERSLLQALLSDEQAHVQAVSGAVGQLGGTVVAKPGLRYQAGTFGSRDSIWKTAHAIEEAGLRAVLGQAGNLQTPAILQAAASIYGIECRHSALTALVVGLPVEGGVFSGASETPMTRADATAALAPFVASWPNTGFAPAGS
jgi:Ferritin-like domain